VETCDIIIDAVCLVLVIEGVFYFALPDISRPLLKKLLEARVESLRRIGMIAIAIGLGLIWIASSL